MWKKRKIKSRKRKNVAKFFLLVIVFLLIVFGILIFKLGILNIKKIDIDAKDISCIEENKLQDLVKIKGQNFFFVNQKDFNQIKEKFLCIKQINLYRGFPNTVKLVVSSRKPLAILVPLQEKEASGSVTALSIATPSAKQIKDAFVIDDEGIIFGKNSNGGNTPKIYTNDLQIFIGNKIDRDLTNNILQIINQFKKMNIEARENWMNNELFVVNPYSAKPKVIFNSNSEIAVQLASLQLIIAEAKIISSELEFIDLRFDKPIVKFAPKK